MLQHLLKSHIISNDRPNFLHLRSLGNVRQQSQKVLSRRIFPLIASSSETNNVPARLKVAIVVLLSALLDLEISTGSLMP